VSTFVWPWLGGSGGGSRAASRSRIRCRHDSSELLPSTRVRRWARLVGNHGSSTYTTCSRISKATTRGATINALYITAVQPQRLSDRVSGKSQILRWDKRQPNREAEMVRQFIRGADSRTRAWRLWARRRQSWKKTRTFMR
jgi:hypothetical protein